MENKLILVTCQKNVRLYMYHAIDAELAEANEILRRAKLLLATVE